MKSFLIPTLLTVALLIVAVTISLDLSGYLDSRITCGEQVGGRAGCVNNLGQSLSVLWGIVAALIGLIWLRFRDI
jgi:hypothetical protein